MVGRCGGALVVVVFCDECHSSSAGIYQDFLRKVFLFVSLTAAIATAGTVWVKYYLKKTIKLIWGTNGRVL